MNYQDFLDDLSGELGRGDLVDEEPSGEEQPDTEQDQGQVRIDLRVDRAGIAAHRFEVQLKGKILIVNLTTKVNSCLDMPLTIWTYQIWDYCRIVSK
jgi:hypothetical protein